METLKPRMIKGSSWAFQSAELRIQVDPSGNLLPSLPPSLPPSLAIYCPHFSNFVLRSHQDVHSTHSTVVPTLDRRAYELGDLVFKAQACEIWGLSPDLFADPEAWHLLSPWDSLGIPVELK